MVAIAAAGTALKVTAGVVEEHFAGEEVERGASDDDALKTELVSPENPEKGFKVFEGTGGSTLHEFGYIISRLAAKQKITFFLLTTRKKSLQ